MESNSLRPYPGKLTILLEARVYEFTVASGTRYFIALTAFPLPVPLLAEKALVLSLDTAAPSAADVGTDPRIQATMLAQMEQLLRERPAAIIVWVCSPANRQEAARHRKFAQWLRHYNQNAGLLQILKVDSPSVDGQYVSLLYRADHPDRAEIEALPLDKLDKF